MSKVVQLISEMPDPDEREGEGYLLFRFSPFVCFSFLCGFLFCCFARWTFILLSTLKISNAQYRSATASPRPREVPRIRLARRYDALLFITDTHIRRFQDPSSAASTSSSAKGESDVVRTVLQSDTVFVARAIAIVDFVGGDNVRSVVAVFIELGTGGSCGKDGAALGGSLAWGGGELVGVLGVGVAVVGGVAEVWDQRSKCGDAGEYNL